MEDEKYDWLNFVFSPMNKNKNNGMEKKMKKKKKKGEIITFSDKNGWWFFNFNESGQAATYDKKSIFYAYSTFWEKYHSHTFMASETWGVEHKMHHTMNAGNEWKWIWRNVNECEWT